MLFIKKILIFLKFNKNLSCPEKMTILGFVLGLLILFFINYYIVCKGSETEILTLYKFPNF